MPSIRLSILDSISWTNTSQPEMQTSGYLLVAILGVLAFHVLGTTATPPSHEQRLMGALMNYMERLNPTGVVRPVDFVSENITVQFGVALLSINNIDFETGLAELVLWERMAWRDKTLTWTPEQFGGIDKIRMPMSKPMWKADITLYNSVAPQSYSEDTLGVLSSDGSMFYIPPAVRKVKCAIVPGSVFSKDVAKCSLKYASWTYDGWKIDLDLFDGLKKLDVSDYIPDRRYEILSHPARKDVKYYPCCQEPYPSLTFELNVELA